jgi:hypothetical protein
MTAGARDLVLLSRELQAEKSEQPFNTLITGNADHLKWQALQKLVPSSALSGINALETKSA